MHQEFIENSMDKRLTTNTKVCEMAKTENELMSHVKSGKCAILGM